MGKAGWASFTSTLRSGGGLAGPVGKAGKRVRDRFKRSD
jgi:hypothetical protein